MNCRVCAIPIHPWGFSGLVPQLRCPRCGSIHAECAKPVEDLYADLYRKDEEVPAVVAASLDEVVRSMRPFRTDGKWLDIGFGQGALLDAVARGGWLSYGTELSEVALEKGRARGFATAKDTEVFPDGVFDVVSLVELVEHVEEPLRFLKEARRVLRKGGCLYLTTPNAWSLNRWYLGAAWTVFGPPDHITIFTPGGLTVLLRTAGFERVTVRAEGFNPVEILAGRRGNAGAPEFNRVEAGTRLCQSFGTSPARRRVKRLINAGLNLVRGGDSLKARAC